MYGCCSCIEIQPKRRNFIPHESSKIINLSDKQSFPEKTQPSHRYLFSNGILECYSTYCYKIIMFHSKSKKVILDLKIFYHLISLVSGNHLKKIKSKFRIQKKSNLLKIYYSKTLLFDIIYSTIPLLREDLYSTAFNSLLQLSALFLCDDRRQILHYIVTLFKNKIKNGMELDQLFLLNCLEFNDLKHLANLFVTQQKKIDFVEIQISAFYWHSES